MPVCLPDPYRDEAACVAACQRVLDDALDWSAVQQTARPWLQALRAVPAALWTPERLLQHYPLSSPAGLALMRLAEALLRVPDRATALALLADQLGSIRRTDLSALAPTAQLPLLERLLDRLLLLAQRCLPKAQAAAQPVGSAVAPGGAAHLLLAVARRAAQGLGQQFVLGQTLAQAMQARDPALRYSFDMLGEGARTEDDALRYLASYRSALDVLAHSAHPGQPVQANDGLSIKLSALHPRFEPAQRTRVLAELVPRLWGLCEHAARANLPLTLDAEESERLALTLEVFDALLARVAQQHPHWAGLGLAVQAYQTRALALCEAVLALAQRHGVRLMCRLVKGAYWDSEIKRAQELGLAYYPVFTHKAHTDLSYLACARTLLAAPHWVYPQFASHNAVTLAAVLHLARAAPGQAADAAAPAFEFQRLQGMGEAVYRHRPAHPAALSSPFAAQALHSAVAVPVRVYAPVGAHRELLAYLVRRLLENGANTSFVHQLGAATPAPDGLPEGLLAPPCLQPTVALPLPADLFAPERANSPGLDLAVATHHVPLLAAQAALCVPSVPVSNAQQVAKSYAASMACYPNWSTLPVAQRAACLQRAADACVAQLPQLCALLVQEARKTWPDALAEVREAIDLLRYYAAQASTVLAPRVLPGVTGERNTLQLRPRGVWVCISPWNFPLAIFMGQVAAALVTGNTVLAKPASATPAVAAQAVQLLHAAGVPPHAVQLLHGPGAVLGPALLGLPALGGVVFTGSTSVARELARTLAAQDGPLVPLIAETGGVNAMLVDSTALPEQVVDAVLQSAFRSAGQRCSALRLLCLHEAVAEPVLTLLRGAVRELVVGDPALLQTDVGPLIDASAAMAVQRAVQRLFVEQNQASGLSECAHAAMNSVANLVPPVLIEVARLDAVGPEIFGPVLQVLRWRGDPLALMAQINALGYGLTLGLQTRIDSRARALAAAARVGNVYVNRSMIGAVVGAQPFGGQGLSGTGPKAGGPHYLSRFCTEQTVSINTAAAGGNAALLTQSTR